MPQIPRYSQQAGGVVQFPTTSLPKLSSAPFEQAALSQAAATQDVLGAVADVAATFEKKRQEAEFFNLEQEFRKKINDETFALVTSDTSQNVDEWLPVSEKYTTTLASELDSVSGISSTLKARLKNSMLGIASSRLYDGKKNSFDRDIANKSELTNNNVNSIVKDAADADGQEIETPQGRISKSEIILADALSLVERGVDLGYDLDIVDERGLRFAVDAEILNRKIELDDSSIESYVNEEQNILNGVGKYARYDLNERRDLAAEVSSHINQMEQIRVYEISADSDKILKTMAYSLPDINEDGVIVMTANNKMEQSFNELMSMANELERFGAPSLASDLRSKALIQKNLYETNDEIAFTDDSYIAGKRKELLDAVEQAPNTDSQYNAIIELETFDELVAARDKSLREDPVNYIIQQHSRVSNQPITKSGIVDYQTRMGVPDYAIKVMTESEVSQLQEVINSGDINEAYDTMVGFFNSDEMSATVNIDGEDVAVGDLAMRQMRGSGLSLAMNIVASNSGHPQAKNLLDVSRMDKDTFKSRTEKVETDVKDDVADAVKDSLEEYKSSVVGDPNGGNVNQLAMGGRVVVMDEMQEDIENFALFLVATNNMQPQRAAEVASSIILDQFAFVDVVPSATGVSTGTIRMKRDKEPHAKNISVYLSKYLDSVLPQKNIKLPNEWNNYYETEDVARSVYVDEIARGGRWVTNDNHEGVYLVNSLGNPVTTVDELGNESVISMSYNQVLGNIDFLNANPELLDEFSGQEMTSFGEPKFSDGLMGVLEQMPVTPQTYNSRNF